MFVDENVIVVVEVVAVVGVVEESVQVSKWICFCFFTWQVFTYIYLFFPRYANYNSDGLPVHDSSGNELGRREKEAMMKEQQKLKSRWEAEEEKLFEDMGAVARLYNQTTTMIREDKQVRKKQLGGVR